MFPGFLLGVQAAMAIGLLSRCKKGLTPFRCLLLRQQPLLRGVFKDSSCAFPPSFLHLSLHSPFFISSALACSYLRACVRARLSCRSFCVLLFFCAHSLPTCNCLLPCFDVCFDDVFKFLRSCYSFKLTSTALHLPSRPIHTVACIALTSFFWAFLPAVRVCYCSLLMSCSAASVFLRMPCLVFFLWLI